MDTLVDMSDTQESSFDPLPTGEYTVVVEKAEVTVSKTGSCKFISTTLKVASPTKHEGRKTFDRFMIWHENAQTEANGELNGPAKAVKYAKEKLKTFLKVAGVSEEQRQKLTDVNNLVGLVANAKVTIKSDEYGEGNEVKFYKEPTGQVPGIDKDDDGLNFL